MPDGCRVCCLAQCAVIGRLCTQKFSASQRLEGCSVVAAKKK